MKSFPPPKRDPKIAEAIKELSRLKYGRPKEVVEAEIIERTKVVSSKMGMAGSPEPERFKI